MNEKTSIVEFAKLMTGQELQPHQEKILDAIKNNHRLVMGWRVGSVGKQMFQYHKLQQELGVR